MHLIYAFEMKILNLWGCPSLKSPLHYTQIISINHYLVKCKSHFTFDTFKIKTF